MAGSTQDKVIRRLPPHTLMEERRCATDFSIPRLSLITAGKREGVDQPKVV